MKKKEIRNTGLDLMKLLAAYFVCIQHTVNSEGVFSYLLVLTRVAVPLFFMVTGYYIADSNPRKYIKKILAIIVEMMLLYFGIDFLKACIQRNAFSYLKNIVSISSIIKFVVFNKMPFAGHGWYLWALIYSYPIVFICVKKKKIVSELLLTVFGIAVLLALGKYSILLFGIDIEPYYTMTWYAVGIPFLFIGNYICNYKNYITQYQKKLPMLIIVFFIFNLLERFVLQSYIINATRETYFCTIVLSILIFVFFLEWNPKSNLKALASWGKLYSTDVYIYHILVARILKIVVVRVFGSTMLTRNIIIPTLVIVVVTLCAIVKRKIALLISK